MSCDLVFNERWSSVTVDADLPDKRFAWKPPAGWTKWKRPDPRETSPKPGTQGPDFHLTLVDGGRSSFLDFRGQVVWFYVWKAGSPACREEMCHLQKLYGKYKDYGLVVLGLTPGRTARGRSQSAAGKRGDTFPNIIEDSEATRRVYEKDYPYAAWPTSYVIGP